MSEQNTPDGQGPGGPGGGGPNPWIRSLMIWGGVFLALLLAVSMFGGASQNTGTVLNVSSFLSTPVIRSSEICTSLTVPLATRSRKSE